MKTFISILINQLRKLITDKILHTIVFIFAVSTVIVSCGGSGGGDDTIEGSVFGSSALISRLSLKLDDEIPNTSALSKVEVCCLGECDVSDDNGSFNLSGSFSSNTDSQILCHLTYNTDKVPVIVDGIIPNPHHIVINFTQDPANPGAYTFIIVSQTAVSTTQPQATATASAEVTPEVTSTPDFENEATPAPEPTATTDDFIQATSTSTPDTTGQLGCESISGEFLGNGGCGVTGPISVSNDGLSVFINLPSDQNASFEINSGDSTIAASASHNLTIFGKTGHTCNITCNESGNSIILFCTNTTGGSCTETLSLHQ